MQDDRTLFLAHAERLQALEELGLDYQLKPVDIFKGEQHDPDFLRLSPNGRMPTIVDTAPAEGGPPITVSRAGRS